MHPIANESNLAATKNADLMTPYNATIGKFLETTAGGAFVAICALVAVCLTACLVFALVMKGLNRPNQFVNQFFPSTGKAVVMVLVAWFFATVKWSLPALIQVGQWLMNGIMSWGTDYLNIGK